MKPTFRHIQNIFQKQHEVVSNAPLEQKQDDTNDNDLVTNQGTGNHDANTGIGDNQNVDGVNLDVKIQDVNQNTGSHDVNKDSNSLDVDQEVDSHEAVDGNDEESPITQDHINHARVCNALVSVCADALREILLSKVPTGYPSIYAAIKANRGMLRLRQEQLSLIYPDPNGRFTGTVDQFDITILYTLIRNISSVQAPLNGWGHPPDDNPRDTSLGANVERIRQCRNKVSGHSVDGKLDNQSLQNYWREIEDIIDDIENAIGDRGFKNALERRKNQIITPEEAHLLKIKINSYQEQIQGLYIN